MKIEIMAVLGFPCRAYEGTFGWLSKNIPSAELIAAVESLPQDEATFLALDMDTAGIPKEHLLKLKEYQCERISELRRQAYAEIDHLWFAAEGDGDSKEPWIAARLQVKAKLPWPGGYSAKLLNPA